MNPDGLHNLLAAAQARDPAARNELFTRMRAFVQAAAAHPRFQFGPTWTAGDLIQETLRRADDRLHTFAGGTDDAGTAAALRAWLGEILQSVYANRVRHETGATRRPPGERVPDLAGLIDANRTPGTLAADADDHDRVQTALARLSPDHRELFELVEFQGLSQKDAADRLGLTISEFRTRRDHALSALRAALG